MSVPNLLTIMRFVLIPVYLDVFFSGHRKLALVVLLLAGITDVVDGYLARKNNQVTELGSMLDPLADKSMMLAVFLSLVFSGMISWLAACAMLIRDVGMIIGSAVFHFRGKKTVPANTMGKLTTVLYYVAILMIVFEVRYAMEYLWIVIAFSFVTTFNYILNYKRINRSQPLSRKDQSG